MINAHIAELVASLANESIIDDQLCEFLTTHTFSFLHVHHCWLAELTSRETVRARASFGVDQSKFLEWQEFPRAWKLPVTDALNEKRLVWINTLPQWPDEYPRLHGVEFDKPTRSQIIVPIIRFNAPVAGLGIASCEKIEIDEELEIFFRTIANLISLHLFRQARERKKLESENVTSLTDRQIQILSHIANRKTNVEIGEIMGYSESTIRQETMRIFEKLQVNGRNEARAYFLKNTERLGISRYTPNEMTSSREEFAH